MLRTLRQWGEVLTEHVGAEGLAAVGESLADETIHDRDLEWLRESDIVVAEVSTPSLGVGYEIAHAIHAGKPVIALYRTGSARALSAMIAGAPGVCLIRYSDADDLVVKLNEALRESGAFERGADVDGDMPSLDQ